MLRVENKVLGMCSTNCYFLFEGGARTPSGAFIDDTDSKEAIIVDPAADYRAIDAQIKKYNLIPKAILLTHGHFDHILAVNELRSAYGIKAYALEAEKEILLDANKNLSLPFSGEAFTTEADIYLKDGDKLKIAGYDIKVLAVPGHTVGGACYYFPSEKTVITGDTLFAQSVGRSDFPTGSGATLVKSIAAKLFTLPEETKVYPGHGESTTIGYEKEYNLYAGLFTV